MQGELKPSSIKISRLMTKIIEGELKIPPFQRAFVWNQEQVIELLDSIYNDYPIGSVLLWESQEELPSNREVGGFNIPDKRPELPWTYVLDGQQRITSIFGVFCDRDIKRSDDELANKFNITFDFMDNSFKSSNDINDETIHIPLEYIFDNYAFNKYLQNKSFDEKTTIHATKLQSIFQNYELPTVTITKRAKNEVGTIFERINNTGTALSTLDLLIAWTWSSDYYLKEVFDNILDTMEEKSFSHLKDKLILQCFSAVISQSTKTKDILELDPTQVRDKTTIIIDCIKKAIDILSTEFGITTDEFLPKPQQFVGIVYLYSKINSLSGQQLDAVKTWFWRTSFSNRYNAGTDEKMNEDISFFNRIASNDTLGLDKYKSELTVDVFLKKSLVKTNSWSKATLLLLATKMPLDLTSGQKIDIGKSLSAFNRKEYHHIFPRKFLKDKYSLPTPEINILANFCFLPSGSNKKISSKAPSDYFANSIFKKERSKIFESNVLPEDETIYSNDEYDKFKVARAKMLYKIGKKLAKEKIE